MQRPTPLLPTSAETRESTQMDTTYVEATEGPMEAAGADAVPSQGRYEQRKCTFTRPGWLIGLKRARTGQRGSAAESEVLNEYKVVWVEAR